jgi:hypothetical protein
VILGATGGTLVGVSAKLVYEDAKTEFVKETGRDLTPGKAVIAAEMGQDGLIEFEAQMERARGTVLIT